ncbi:MAG: hypothetical protein H6977_17265 [Gammaproteobacteria bacterium]|nr:hypothetical protein [Gammaproteobacteria bacterium]
MKLVITPHRPLRKLLLTVAGLLAVALALAFALDYGHWRAIAGAMVARGDQRELVNEVVSLRRENDALRYDLTRARRAEQIARAAREENRALMVDLKAELAAREQEVRFYRNALGDVRVGAGPRVGGIQVKPLDGDGRYGYSLVMTYVDKDDRVVEGRVQVRLAGEMNGRPEELPFADIVESGPATLDFKFKHFHLFEGTLKIPAQFVPRRIEVAVVDRGRSSSARAESFDWAAALN